MATTTDMVALYAEIAPAFIEFLQKEKAAIQSEIARFKDEEPPTASDKQSPAIQPDEVPTKARDTKSPAIQESEEEDETVFDPTAH